MHGLKDYTMCSTLKRNAGHKHWEDTSIEFEFEFPINEFGCNRLIIVAPTFEVYEGNSVSASGLSAGSILDDFVNLNYDLSVVYNPSPEPGAPRLSIQTVSAPEKIIIY